MLDQPYFGWYKLSLELHPAKEKHGSIPKHGSGSAHLLEHAFAAAHVLIFVKMKGSAAFDCFRIQVFVERY